MAKIQDDILADFLGELAKMEGFSAERIESLRQLFKADKKPKPTDLVKALSDAPRDELK